MSAVSTQRIIAHVDADCFFASVELIDRPELKYKPVVVCTRTDNRGIVTAANYIARKFGIKAGTPNFKLRTLCPSAVKLQSNFSKYETVSQKLILILKNISPYVEYASIDEAYLDLTGMELLYKSDAYGIAKKIQLQVYNDLSITVSIGIAPTKLLAKIASDRLKPNGVTWIKHEMLPLFLEKILIKEIPGVGSATQKLLTNLNIKTAGDLVSTPHISGILGKRGEDICRQLLGKNIEQIKQVIQKPKTLSCTRTFESFTTNREEIFNFSMQLLTALCRRLRAHKLEARVLVYILVTKNFELNEKKIELACHTDEYATLINEFKRIFDEIFTNDLYRKSGFFLYDLREQGPQQYSLFDIHSNGLLSDAIDKITCKFGESSISWNITKNKFDK